MINHARALLLNVSSESYKPGTLGEEYIPTYTPLKLPTFLHVPHRIIFGTDPDRVFLNYRAAELMRLLHQTELAEFIYALDNRVTYWPQPTTEFFRPETQITAQKIFGLYETRLNIIGKPKADNKVGRCYSQYTARVSGYPNEELVTITEDSSIGAVEVPLTWLQNNQLPIMRLQTDGVVGARGLSEPITLQDGLLNVQFADLGSLPPKLLLETKRRILGENYEELPFALESGTDLEIAELRRLAITDSLPLLALWRFSAYARPASAIVTCLPQLEFLGEPVYIQLFGVRSDVEPYATFKNIWEDHPNSVYRFAAFLMAMIYRTDELRSRSNG
jgi:hypothetical protein